MYEVFHEPIFWIILGLIGLWAYNNQKKKRLHPEPPLTFWGGVGRLGSGFLIGVVLFVLLVVIGLGVTKGLNP